MMMWLIQQMLAGFIVGFIAGYLGKKFAKWTERRKKL